MIYFTANSPTGTRNMNTTSFNLRDIGEKSNTVPESKASLSVVIPVYNSEGIILDLHKKLTNELSLLVKNYELIFVNDSSPDNIWTKIQLLAKADPHVKAISLRRNFGYDSALMAGLNYVSYPYVVIMDDDLQHNPEDIPQLLSEIEKGYDVVYGNFPLKKQSFVKNLGSWFVGKLAQFIVNKPARLQITSYKIFRKEIAKGISQYGGPYPYIDGLIFQMTSSIHHVMINHHERAQNKGGHGILKSMGILFNFCTTFSILPLRIAVFLGLVISLGAGVFSIGLVIVKLWLGIDMEGWTSIILAITISGGIQLIGLGLLGEYVGRTYMNINRQPQYVIKETISIDSAQQLNEIK
tara:strand:+ start:306 stop:1364 length:1059 start_codon:yes stop_codon:yes gene_type:complete